MKKIKLAITFLVLVFFASNSFAAGVSKNISVLVPQKTDVELLPPPDVVVAARLLGGLIGVGMLEGGKATLKKHFSMTVEDLKKFNFENYIADQLVKKISSEEKFKAQKDNRPIIKKIFTRNFLNALNPRKFMKRAGYKKFRKKELVKIDNNLFLHYAFQVILQGNKKFAKAGIRIVFAIGTKEEKEAIWVSTKIIQTKEFSPEDLKKITPELVNLLDGVITNVVDSLHSTEIKVE